MAESGVSPLIIKYERQLEEDPRSRVFAPLAEAYRKVGLVENAFNVLKKGLRYNPDYLLGYLTLAQCYMDKGEFALCYSTLRPLVPGNRDNIKLQKLFGDSAILTENKEEALDTFKYLLFLQPKDPEVAEKVQRLEAELQEGIVYQPTEDVKFKVDDLNPSPELDRSLDDWVQVDLSSSEASETELESDQDEDEKHLESSEVEEGGWSTEILSKESQPQAPDLEEKATPVMTHTLVDLYLKQGHKEKAIELLRKIQEIQPDNEDTLKRLQELEALSPVESENGLSQSEDREGHDSLMAAFDNVRPDDDTELHDEKLVEVLDDFAEVLRKHAQEHLSS